MTANVLSGIERQLAGSLPWMSWNLLLALVPWALAVWLFREGRPVRRWGVVAAVVCLAFLPNAAYVLTDVIHLPRHVRAEPSDAVVLVGVLPLFVGFMAVGFLAYVDTVRRIGSWVRSMGWVRRAWPTEVGLHAASTVGIYLGRVHRFNSWDLLDRPGDIGATAAEGLTRSLPLVGMLLTLAILVVGHAAVLTIVRGCPRRIAGDAARSNVRILVHHARGASNVRILTFGQGAPDSSNNARTGARALLELGGIECSMTRFRRPW